MVEKRFMPIKLIRHLSQASLPSHGVVTIGNFDGVHLGHAALVKRVVQLAKENNSPSLVMTFEPHPYEFFSKEKLTIPRLTKWREKLVALQVYHPDYLIILKFNQLLATMQATDFVQQILHDLLHMKHLVIGDDFQFGYQRKGNIQLLHQMGKSLGFTVEAMPTIMVENERVSSTRIRQALAQANHQLANQLLGRSYSMLGRVEHGAKIGRQLGFPTINIALHRQLTPVHGVYVVYVKGVEDGLLAGVANVGTRPAVNGDRCLLEVHLLNFNREIYGHHVEVIFCEKLREEVMFDTLDDLKEQIKKDVLQARAWFKKNNTF